MSSLALVSFGRSDNHDRPAKRRRTCSEVANSFSLSSLDITSAACQRCHSRKVKCDSELPGCAPCRRADLECMVYDPSAPRAYTRREFQKLYEKAQRLEAELRDLPTRPGSRDDGEPEPEQLSRNGQQRHLSGFPASGRGTRSVTREQVASERQQRQRDQAPTENRFVGQEHTAFSVFLSRLDRSRVAGTATQQNPETRAPRMPYCAPHPFPTRDVALAALQKYFQHFHPFQPVLSVNAVYDALDKYFDARPDQKLRASELFRLLMGIAIGSICLSRDGALNLHPFGYFTAALEAWTPALSSFNGIEDIEHLLLIAHFGLFYDIGCSVWELGRLATKTAVELGLHRLTPVKSISGSPAMISRSRRVFWMVYLLDRSSSRTLGRPFAIDDASIQTPLPEADNSKSAYHNWRIGLGKITSRIRCDLTREAAAAAVSAHGSQESLRAASAEFVSTVALLRRFNTQLREWRDWAPVQQFGEEIISVFDTTAYMDLLYQEARLSLFRAAIDKLGSSPLSPPRSLLKQSLAAACGVIYGFEKLRVSSMWMCNRAEAHTVFVTSLVILSLTQASDGMAKDRDSSEKELFGSNDDLEDPWSEFLEDDGLQLNMDRVSSVISVAGQLLAWVSEALPDFALYARIFDDTKRSLSVQQSVHRLTEPQSRAPLSSGIHGNEVATYHNLGSQPSNSDDIDFTRGTTAALDYATGTGAFFDLTTAIPTEGLDMGPLFGMNGISSWPLSNLEGIAALDACFSGFVYDTNVPWDGSPSTMDSV